MLQKSHIFYFSLSFIITFAVGFFIWNIFVSPDNGITRQVLAEINKINSKFFAASLPSSYQIVKVDNFAGNQPSSAEVLNKNEITNSNIITEQQRQDLLDDIQEKLDIIQQKVNELSAQQNKDNKLLELAKETDNKIEDDKIDQDDKEDQNLDNKTENTSETKSCTGQININTASEEDLDKIIQVGPVTAQKIIQARPFYSLNDLLKVSGIGPATLQEIINQGCAFVENGVAGGGGYIVEPVVYPKILILEVQISSIGQRFVELYNPNSTDVNLTGWYLQRRTQTSGSWSSFVSSPKFEGKIIPANGYFLISRELENSDILYDITLSDNNSLVLKNPDHDIVDQVNWEKIINSLSWCADFSLCTPTPKYSNIAFVEAPVEPLAEEKDTTAPQASFSINANQTELSFSISFTITDLVGTVTPSGIGSYVFRWQDEENDWQSDEPTNISSSPVSGDFIRNFTGENGKTYNFQVQAIDIAGNISDWLPAIPATVVIDIPVVQKPILINKIQLAGKTAKDEFVELYNPNNSSIDLSGYSLKKKTSSGTESNLVSSGSFVGTISSLGYFLIAPKINDDGTPNYTGSATPDLYYSGKTYSVASNNTVLLYNKDGNLQDKVGFGTAVDFETSPASNPAVFEILARTGGIDTDNNSLDFSIITTTSPTNN